MKLVRKNEEDRKTEAVTSRKEEIIKNVRISEEERSKHIGKIEEKSKHDGKIEEERRRNEEY